jgi:hypothetical protein
VQAFGDGLANLRALSTLELDFSSCQAVAREGTLGDRWCAAVLLPCSFTACRGVLRRRLRRCSQLTGVEALGVGLVQLEALTTLDMNFDKSGGSLRACLISLRESARCR